MTPAGLTKDKNFYKNIFVLHKVCVIVPTYNNCSTLKSILDSIIETTDNLIVINDGSTDETSTILKKYKKIEVISYSQNVGKGYALRRGFLRATELGYKYAITLDSDGQHFVDDIPAFLEKLTEEPDSLIVGARNMEQAGIPGKSSFGHKFSNFWFRFETGKKLPDTQSGFRLYPLEKMKDVKFFSKKFEFEIEVLVRSAWRDIKITSVPIKVVYLPKETRISHFRPVTDFFRVSILNTILVLISLLIVKPFHFVRRLNKKDVKAFLRDNITDSGESNAKIAFSIAFGILWGILPVWGWQLAFAISLAYLFKLNKLIVIATANISIPPMIPLILFLSYKTGGWILGINTSKFILNAGINLESIKTNLYMYIVGSIVFAFIASLVSGFLSYFLLTLFRKKNI